MKEALSKRNVAICTACMMFISIFSSMRTVAVTTDKNDSSGAGNVSVQVSDNECTIGNNHISRIFNIQNGKVTTTKIINKRTESSETDFVPQKGSEEFVIKTIVDQQEAKAIEVPTTSEISRDGWKVSDDGNASGKEGDNGPASKMFDGNDETFYNSNDGGSGSGNEAYPHNVYIDMKSSKTFKAFTYQQRVANGVPTSSGHIKDFALYTGSTLEEAKKSTTPVFTGTFKDEKISYINIPKDITTQFLRIEFKNGYDSSDAKANNNLASGSEIKFYSDSIKIPAQTQSEILSSNLTLKGKPLTENTDNGKKLTFKYEPTLVNGVEYSIEEVINMNNNDSFMRKNLNISVPTKDADKTKIDYIDLENINIADSDLVKDQYWTIPEQEDNKWMGGMKGDYLELGQPFYLSAMYFGCEFPLAENKIRDGKGYIRYHYGKSLGKDPNFDYNLNNTAGKMETWPVVVGAARSKDYSVVQSDFYKYIETIATKTKFRKQYNSWFDHMKDISADNIKESFNQVEKGFTQNGIEPLDSYVVDDGWVNYNSFWQFNDKFPNKLYDSSLQVKQLGSNFGLWLGPRGGYGTEWTISNWIEEEGLGSVNGESYDINISDARYLNKLRDDIFLNYQNQFDINYWKLDGMLLNPSREEGNQHVVGGENGIYTVSETYERWTDIFEKMRQQRKGKDLWINLTSFVNPSPWYLQWVNSVWMQNSADVDFQKDIPGSDEEQMLTYRDNAYYEFVNNRQWQMPFKYFYNHDPVYGNRTHEGKGRDPINFTTDELREYLYMLGTRGNAFWEYYYSYNMFDDDKWQVNAEATKWIESNFETLKNSKMIGGNPSKGEIYGYSAWNGNNGVVSLRNPSNSQTQSITINYDRLIGLAENVKGVYGKVVIGDNKFQTNKPLNYGDSATYELKPMETLIIQYGPQDTKAPEIVSIHGDKTQLKVEFNERIQTPIADNFVVDGYKVSDAKVNADRRTVTLKLDKELKDTENINVIVNGIKDITGNITKDSKISDDYYADNIITSVVNKNLDGTSINKGKTFSVDGNKGFSVSGTITTESKGSTIVEQQGAFAVTIDDEGYLNFELNGLKANSKFTETLMKNGEPASTVKGLIADGKEHTFAAVKEVNGMLKLYIDGTLVGSKYDSNNKNVKINKGDVVFGEGLVGSSKYITLFDKALAFNEVPSCTSNVMLSSSNSKVSINAYMNDGKVGTERVKVPENPQHPFSQLNDGSKLYKTNYAQLDKSSDGNQHSRYFEIDLGDMYNLSKINLFRYANWSPYNATVISLSETEDFSNPKIVFNSDSENVHGLGEGKDEIYDESGAGKIINLNSEIKARYIRLYVYGNKNGTSADHIVELEAIGNKVDSQLLSARIDYTELKNLVNEDLSSKYTADSIASYKEAAKDILQQAKAMIDNNSAKTTNEITDLVDKIKECKKVLVPLTTNNSSSILLDRISGPTRFETSFAILDKGWTTTDVAVLASGNNSADALCAAPLAAKYNAPIVLVDNSNVQKLIAELQKKQVKTVYIVGGTSTVPEAVDSSLKAAGIGVTRLAGPTRFETSVRVAEAVLQGNNGQSEVEIANAYNFADALSISAIAAHRHAPILLTANNGLSDEVSNFIKVNTSKISHTYVIGGENSIADGLLKTLPNVERVSGTDRYATNKAVLDKFVSDINKDQLYIASGETYPDALAVSALVAKNGNFLALTPGTSLSSEIKQEITSIKTDIKTIHIIGGVNTLSDNVMEQIKKHINN